jgi:membrane protease YdiL (CAAX protease family)
LIRVTKYPVGAIDMSQTKAASNWDAVAEKYLFQASQGSNAWWRYLLSILLGLAAATAAAILISILLAVFKLLPADIARQLNRPSDPWLFFGTVGVLFALVCCGIAAAARLIQHKRPGNIIGCWQWSLFGWGLAVWIVVQSVLAVIDFAIAPCGFYRGGNLAPVLALWVFGAILIQTFTEEFIFRGLITQGIFLLLRRPLPAACVSGLVFGAMHVPNGWPQAINAVWFGVVCAYLAMRTGGIALTCGIHLANNYFGATGVVSAEDVFKGLPGLFIQNTPQLAWWDLALAILALTALPIVFRKFGILPAHAKG